MTLARDLAWQNLERTYRSTVAYEYARYVLRLDYGLLPGEVVHQAKLCLLDTLGCAIGAFMAPGLPVCEAAAVELGGPEEATIYGSGRRTSAMNATLVNSFLVRFLDYNDLGGGGHNSDSIPGLLAVGEREKATGRQFLTSIVVSYELGSRFREVLSEKGCPDLRGGFNLPPSMGRLMGLSEDQIANAIGICASHCLPLEILDADREENFMTKNLRLGFVSYHSILSCILAKKGFTGPVRVLEGDGGLAQLLFPDRMDVARLTDFSGWRILNTKYKPFPFNFSSIGHVVATLSLVKEHDLRPEDIASVKIGANAKESAHTTVCPAKKYPRTAENADHSAFYLNALAILDRTISPESFDPDRFTDPAVLDMIERITVAHDPTMPKGKQSFQGSSEITTRDGRVFHKRIEVPHGTGNDPMTDDELEDKFRAMALKYMKEDQAAEIIRTVRHVEDLDDVGRLARLMVFRG